MVRLRIVGGGLSLDLEAMLADADRAQNAGDNGTAATLYRKVLSLAPHHPEASHRLGVIALQLGNAELSLQLFDTTLTSDPHHTHAHVNRCIALRGVGRNAEALESIRTIVAAHPELGDAWGLFGQILQDRNIYTEAETCYQHALKLQPSNVHFLGNYALLLFAMDRLEEAYLMARQAYALDANHPPMLLGNILKAWGYPEQAADYFARTYALCPNMADAAASEAMARLQVGDWQKGWSLWEKRPQLDESMNALPLWQGQKIGHLVLYEDQGIGDAIQFMRYIPQAQMRCTLITLRVRTPLLRLCQENFPDLGIITEKQALPDADARCRLSSLPVFFCETIDKVSGTPYLKASAEAKNKARTILSSLPAPRIGLVWAGNKNFRHDNTRSISPSLLQPLLACGAQHFVSLQKDQPDSKANIFDAAPELQDFSDTAGLIVELDLVIAVDTATAHLASALGKPVFMMLPFDNDWRWLIGREDSPWYGAARLFRQTKPGDWVSVIDKVSAAVKKLIAGDRSVLTPLPAPHENLRQNPYALSLPS